jgi:enamine deaminase RidA (YjgF/YER057c/UK114 family)
MRSAGLATVLLCAAAATPVSAHDIIRHADPNLPIASSVVVPAGAELVFVSGMLADAADTSAPVGSVERFGDTETQVKSVLGKLAKELEAAGFTMADVVKMNVFLVGDPRKGGAMDFQGLMLAYSQHFGTDAQKNLPARTTVQVAGLPLPGALVEIEVIAARRHGASTRLSSS